MRQPFLGAGFGLTVPVLDACTTSLSAIFGFTAIVAAGLAALSFAVVPLRSRPPHPPVPSARQTKTT